jgi:hypothetical protein
MLLEFDRIVQSPTRLKRILAFLRQFRGLDEPLKGTSRFVINLDFFGACSGFAFEFLSEHEEVTPRDQESINGGQEGLFLKARKLLIAHLFTDKGAVFCSLRTGDPQGVVIFLVVSAAGERELLIFTPDFRGLVDTFRALIAVEL